MQELLQQLQGQGLNSSQAQGAIQTVVNFLKQRLPDSLDPLLDKVVAEGKDLSAHKLQDLFQGGMPSNMEEAKGMLGKMFG